MPQVVLISSIKPISSSILLMSSSGPAKPTEKRGIKRRRETCMKGVDHTPFDLSCLFYEKYSRNVLWREMSEKVNDVEGNAPAAARIPQTCYFSVPSSLWTSPKRRRWRERRCWARSTARWRSSKWSAPSASGSIALEEALHPGGRLQGSEEWKCTPAQRVKL